MSLSIFHKTVLVLCVAQVCFSRTIMYVPEPGSEIDKMMADVLNEELPDKLIDDLFEYEHAGHQELNTLTKFYNLKVDSLLAEFSTNGRHKKTEGYAVSLYTSRRMVYALQHQVVDNALVTLYQDRCSDAGTNLHRYQQNREFFKLLEDKQTCLTTLDNNLREVALAKVAEEGLSVKEQVMTILACNVFPRLLACLKPTLIMAISRDCTGDEEEWHASDKIIAADHLFQDLEIINREYCANDAELLVDGLQAAPSDCLSSGLNYALKYVGPAFLANVTTDGDPQLMPCQYVSYMSTMLGSIIGPFCDADPFIFRIKSTADTFSENYEC